MNPSLEASIDRLATAARGRIHTLLEGARRRTGKTAERLSDGKRPLQSLSSLGIELTEVSHRATTRLVRQQTVLVEHQLDGLAACLNGAASAGSLVELLRREAKLIPAQAAAFAVDARKSLSIVAGAGSEAGRLLRGRRAGSTGTPRARAATTKTRTAARKAAKKTATKASGKSRKTAKSATTTPRTSAKRRTAPVAGRT